MSDTSLKTLFGEHAVITPLATEEKMGRRLTGIDLSAPLSEEQAHLLVSLVDEHNIITVADQHQPKFHVRHMERLANHFGAPIPHPKNYANYGQPNEDLRLLPIDERASTRSNQAFPREITIPPDADSPAVYVISNLIGGGPDKTPEAAGGQHWHTDIEFEPIPLSTSFFYVQCAPTARETSQNTWVTNPPREPGFYHPESPKHLSELREALPLNGETAYADTAAAYADLSEKDRERLDKVILRRRLRRSDEGWRVPLVYTNPRTGKKSLHSPVWASRGKRVAPAQVEGQTEDESRHFLDDLEAHVLQPQFRYDHAHTPGDVTIWSNFSTLHTAPPYMRVINHPKDARLMYRISCKGEPSYALPRHDSDDWINTHISPAYRSPDFHAI